MGNYHLKSNRSLRKRRCYECGDYTNGIYRTHPVCYECLVKYKNKNPTTKLNKLFKAKNLL